MRPGPLASVGVLLLSVGCAVRAPSSFGRGCPNLAAAPAAGAASAVSAATSEDAGRGIAQGRRTRNIILVTVDGARWQEIFGGVDAARARSAGLPACNLVSAAELLPNLQRWFVDGGVVVGARERAPIVASGPNFVSLPGYHEIFTGRASSCSSNWCPQMRAPTVLDDLAREQQVVPSKIAVITSWERIERVAARDLAGITISAGRHHGASRDRLRVSTQASQLLDEAAAAGAGPGWLDYRRDRYTAALALNYLVAERPRFLFVGLGDTDEHAHLGDYAGYLEALRATDHFVGELMRTLADLGEYGEETTVLITADHGRAANFASHGGSAPESSRVWLLAAGGALSHRGVIDAARGQEKIARLADLAPTMRRLLGLADDRSAGAGQPLGEIVSPAYDGTLVARGSTPR
jgi:phosphopentomutase/2,3-bisphosphoglycerate-independent phosphoglycerate mutase family metalloenzyme